MVVHPGALAVTSSVVDTLALTLTLFRLLFRLRIRRLWWEDLWAAVVFVCGTIFITVRLVCNMTADNDAVLVTSRITSFTFTSTLWAVRMSLLYSTIRVISPSSVFYKYARAIAFLFFFVWAILMSLKAWWCSQNIKSVSAFGRKRRACPLPDGLSIFELIADCISDVILVTLPLKLFWRVKLPRRQRRMILCLFSSAAFMSIMSVFHAVCQLIPVASAEYIAFDLEVTAAMIVCNVLVIVTYMYRVILSSPTGSLPSESESSSEDDDFTTRSPSPLTTVDLDYLTSAGEVTDSNFSRDILP